MSAAVPARVNLITLGVTDRAASRHFYEKLGWQPKARAFEDAITFLALDNLVLALWDRGQLAVDAGLPPTPPGFGGFTSPSTWRTNRRWTLRSRRRWPQAGAC